MVNANTVAATAANFLLTNDAARHLGVSPQTIRMWERTGIIQALKSPRGTRIFSRSDVERLGREREAQRAAMSTPALTARAADATR